MHFLKTIIKIVMNHRPEESMYDDMVGNLCRKGFK